MDRGDRDLGMDRAITRRDFLYGVGATAGALVTSGGRAAPLPVVPRAERAAYPPALGGLRGSHAGSFEVAHQLALQGRRDWGPVREADGSRYDLVVVGGGVSGLSAAWYYRVQNPEARVLVIENHDDFGGHAKRNEFEVGGRKLIGYGGSQSLEAPSDYSDIARDLLRALGVDLGRLRAAYDEEFFRRHGLAACIHFDRATYGVDATLRSDYIDASSFFPLAKSGVGAEESIERFPIAAEARAQLLQLQRMSKDRLPEHSIFSEPSFLMGISYRELLSRHLGVEHPQALGVLQHFLDSYLGVGADATPAMFALAAGLPGIGGTSLRWARWAIDGARRWLTEPYLFHFPDGNATIARLLVRQLIPGIAPGSTMEDVVGAPFDYARLDERESAVRIRLSSTVVRVEHTGAAGSASAVDAADGVRVTYVREGRAESVRARHCVLAGYNMAIPYLCPELPEQQRRALALGVKIPLVYTNVVLRNWRAWKQLGIAVAYSPGAYHKLAMLDFPVSLGGVEFSPSPDDPIIAHLDRVPTSPGLPPRDQHRLGRAELLSTTFEEIEREVRVHLGGLLGGAGFDPADDILALTVNRWPHGYAYEPNRLFDPEAGEGQAPHEIGRQRFGRIAIANSDAGGRAYLDEAINQAHRAVSELLM